MSKIKRTDLGGYYSEMFIIELPPDNKCIDKKSFIISQEHQEDVSTFFHEYFHFLLNVTTFSRFRDLYLLFYLKALFTHTLNSENFSQGSANLTDENKNKLKDLLDCKRAYDGDFLEEDFQKFRIERVTNSLISIKHSSIPIEYYEVSLAYSYEFADENREGTFCLGSLIFEESICKLLEEVVFSTDNSGLPTCPYHIIDALMEHYKIQVSKKVLCYLGVMSLSTTNPPYSFINALEIIQKKIPQEYWKDDQKIINFIKNEIKPIIKEAVSTTEAAVHELIDKSKERPVNFNVMEYYGQKVIKGIQLRTENPTFDLDILLGSQSPFKGLQELLNVFLPCTLIARDEDKPQSDSKVYDFDLNSYNGMSVSEFTLAHQNQTEFLLHHIDYEKYQLMATKKIKARCPSWDICSDELRVNNNPCCNFSPWDSYKTESNCLYNLGITSLLGTSKISRKGNSNDV